jgi:predicted nucleic acid-binding protein
MKAYADTAFLVSLHTRDANTRAAVDRMKRQVVPLPWTWLHELEFRNAVRLRVFRREMELDELTGVLNDQRADIEAGIYLAATPSWSEVTRESERLSGIFTKALGTRSLDVLHVSCAVVLGVKEFLTFDIRQAALAKAAGLKVPKL